MDGHHTVEERRHRVGQLVLTGDAPLDRVIEETDLAIDRIEPLVTGRGRCVVALTGGGFGPDLLDEVDQGLSGALEIGASLPTGEVCLFTCDLGMRGDCGELGVKLTGHPGQLSVELIELAPNLGSLLVPENSVFFQRASCFPTSSHQLPPFT